MCGLSSSSAARRQTFRWQLPPRRRGTWNRASVAGLAHPGQALGFAGSAFDASGPLRREPCEMIGKAGARALHRYGRDVEGPSPGTTELGDGWVNDQLRTSLLHGELRPLLRARDRVLAAHLREHGRSLLARIRARARSSRFLRSRRPSQRSVPKGARRAMCRRGRSPGSDVLGASWEWPPRTTSDPPWVCRLPERSSSNPGKYRGPSASRPAP